MFAAIPLLFATQQAAEGIVWLTMDSPSYSPLHRLAVNTFLAFALVIWPLWIPTSLQLIEPDPLRNRALAMMCCVGVVVATAAAFLLTRWQPDALVAGHSISYQYARSDAAGSRLVTLIAYAIPTIGSFFVSTAYLSRTIGFTLLASVAVSIIVKREALTSVWCFFAAILSALVVVAVSRATTRSASAGRLSSPQQ
jgi:hypothetical protein